MKFTKLFAVVIGAAALSAQIGVSAAQGCINVMDCGAAGDGIADDTGAIRLALERAEEMGVTDIYFPKGTYLTTSTVEIGSNLNLHGSGAASVIKTTMTGDGEGIFEGSGVSGVEIKNLGFTAVGDKIYAAVFYGSSNIRVTENYTDGCAMVRYDVLSGSEDPVCHDTLTSNNILDGGDQKTKVPAIALCSNDNGIVKENNIENYTDGILFESSSEELSINNICSNNTFNYIDNTGVYVKDNERVTVGGNVFKNIGVGICIENAQFTTVVNNVVTDFTDTGMSLKKGGRGVSINANEIYSDADGAKLLEIHASDEKFGHKEVNISSNNFHALDGARAVIQGGDVENLTVGSNHFYNAVMDFSLIENRSVLIASNQMIYEFDYDKEQTAIKAGRTTGQLMVQNNQIVSIDATSGDSCGIYAIQDSDSFSPVTYIKGNSINGMKIDIKTVANAENPLSKPLFLLKNNTLGSENFVREEGHTQSSVVRLEDNYTHRGTNYPSKIPTMGKWEKGQIIYFDSSDESGYIGAVCVAKGTPGIWKYFGKIDE